MDLYKSFEDVLQYIPNTNIVTNDFIDEYRDSEYRGCIGMEMAKRPNSGGAGTAKSYEGSVWTEKSLENKEDKKFGEPIWVWKK